MKYKYKDDVKKVLFEENRVASDPTVLNTAFNMRDELDEVYAKAQAFDEIYKYFREGAHDEYSFTEFFIDLVKQYESGDSE